MIKKIVIIGFGLVIGFIGGYFLKHSTHSVGNDVPILSALFDKKEVIGFLPYWLTGKAKKDYSPYITTLTYFGLTVDGDGSIMKLTNEQEEDPGWHALNSGAMNSFFKEADKHSIKKSLLIFAADQEQIDKLISTPEAHAKKLIEEVDPIMKKYGFIDLNLDIESVILASAESQIHFTQFVKAVKKQIDTKHLGTLTLEASPTVLIKPYLINAREVVPLVDYFVFMTYDYHYQGSYVTGPVAPISGAGTISEYDIEKAIQKALDIVPREKIIMGAPLYGYEWETLDNTPRSAVIPASGIAASNARVEDLLSSCASCSAQFDATAKESYLIYKDQETGTYHQIFYPDKRSMKERIKFATSNGLKGMAFWALGYEGNSILEPLRDYK